MEMFGPDWMQWCEANGAGDTAERLWGPTDAERSDSERPDAEATQR